MRHYKFFIEGPPPLKRRARGRTFYTPKETVIDEKRVRDSFLGFYPTPPRSERVFQVEIHMYFDQPKKSLFDYPTEDGDNIEKAIMDGLQKVLWENDRQITGMMWFQHFTDADNPYEGVWVKAHEL